MFEDIDANIRKLLERAQDVKYHEHIGGDHFPFSYDWIPLCGLSDRVPFARRAGPEANKEGMMHLVNIGRAPTYLINSVTATRDVVSRSCLRSSSSHRYEQPRTRHKLGERSFSFTGPAAWNSLPRSLHELTNTVTFKKNLKTHLSLMSLVHSFYIHIVSCWSFL